MSFSDPRWLAAGLALCAAAIAAWWRHDVRQRAALERFVAARLRVSLTRSVSPMRRGAQRLLLLGALAALCAALAGPQWGYHWEQRTSRGNEIVFALDTSRSMLTADVKPDRLTRAKLAIDDCLNHLDGDAVGIVAFAGSAFLVNPITLDYGAFRESLGAIDTATIPRGGTDIASAIREADVALHRRRGGGKILILITDGENLEGDALAAAKDAGRDGLRIFTIGVGTPAGDLIPLPAAQGGGFVKDESGALVKSRLDEPALEAIAAAAGGFYVPLGVRAEGLDTLFTSGLGPLAKHDLAYRQQKIAIERFQWPLAAGLALLLASLTIDLRRRRTLRRPAPAGASTNVRGTVTASPAVGASTSAFGSSLATLLAVLISLLAAARAVSGPAAASPPAGAPAPDAAFDSGTSDYRAGRFPQAAHAFQQSITQAPSAAAARLAEQEDAYYNLGNTLYRTGQKTEQSSPDETLRQWRAAVQAYDTALQLRPGDADSKFNRDFVQRRIDALRPPPDQDKSPGPGAGGSPPPNGGGPQGRSPPSAAQPQGKGQPPGAGAPGHAPATAPAAMSPDEARELLDSAKGEERHAQGAPLAPARGSPDQPFKNW